MANSVKTSGGGLALQVTREARDAGLVREDSESDPTHLAGVYVYGFDGLLLVVDAEDVSPESRAQLVGAAVGDSGVIHRGEPATVEVAGNGYQVQLPGCEAAGFREGDRAPVVSRPGVLVIHDGTEARLAEDLATIRADQLNG